MSVRNAGLIAPFRWLRLAIDVGHRQPVPVLSAVFALTLISMLPGMLGQGASSVAGASLGWFLNALGVVMAVAVIPVLIAGMLRLLVAAEGPQPARAGQLFECFQDGSFTRLVAIQLLYFATMIGVFAVMAVIATGVLNVPWQAIAEWARELNAAQTAAAAGGTPAAIPALPEGVIALMLLLLAFTPLLLLISLGANFAIAEAALRGTSSVAAYARGLRAAFANAAGLLLLVLALLPPALLLIVLASVVLTGLASLLSLLAPFLAALTTLLVLLLATTLFNAVYFGFLLAGWRAICDPQPHTPPAAAQAPDQGGFEA